jgi:hypothetical protein
MKHLKKYESISLKYFPGDYVLYDGQNLDSKEDQFVKIMKRLTWGDYIFMYDDGTFNATTDEHIKRELTPEEIEEFKMNLAGNKYNL